jgi:hypothetical protein
MAALAQNIEVVMISKQPSRIFKDCDQRKVLATLKQGEPIIAFLDVYCNENPQQQQMVEAFFLSDSSFAAGWIITSDFDQQEVDSNAMPYEENDRTFWIDNMQVLHTTPKSAGIKIQFVNHSEKTIKTISFTVIPYNAQGQVVTDGLGKSSKAITINTSMPPWANATSTDDIIFAAVGIVQYKLSDIKVTYTDGSTETFQFVKILRPKGALW